MNDPVLDPAVLAELRATAGSEFVDELLQTFYAEAPTLLAALGSTQAAGDAAAFRRAAHSLKTNAATFGAVQLAAQARALEQGGLPADTTGIAALQQAYAAATAALKGA